MRGRSSVAAGAGVAVVLTALSAALINELHAGWPWWVAAGAVVLAGAVLAAWLALHQEPRDSGDQLGPGAVKAGRDIRGDVTTTTNTGQPPDP